MNYGEILDYYDQKSKMLINFQCILVNCIVYCQKNADI